MAIGFNYFKHNKAEIKIIHKNNIETLYEKPWLKFRDVEHGNIQESPCTELMVLAREAGIRPQTTANGIKNMFFIHEDQLADFFNFLEKKYPEFAEFVIQKTQIEKENDLNAKEIKKVPHWF